MQTHRVLAGAAAGLAMLLGGCKQPEVVYAKSGGIGFGTSHITEMQPYADALRGQGIWLRVDTTTSGSGQALAAVVQGHAHITRISSGVLLTNSTDTASYAQSTALRTLTPLEVYNLMILSHENLPKIPLAALVRGRSVFCARVGSATHRTALALLEHLGVQPGVYRMVGENRASNFQDSIVFSTESKSDVSNFQRFTAWRWHSLEDAQGTNLAQGFVQDKPYMQAATLPAYTLGHRQPKPVVYLQSKGWLVCRADLPDDVAYELARAFNPETSADGPTLEEVDLRTAPFPLHEGARQYRDRDRPSFVQRNAESLGLLVTVGGLLAAAFGAVLARRSRRNSRIFDNLYARVTELELACAEAETPEDIHRLALEVKALQRKLVQDMSRHGELSDPRSALLQQKLSSCILILHTSQLVSQAAQS